MKIKKVIRDLAPYIAAGMVLGSAIAVNKGCSVEGEVETKKISNCVFPKYNKETLMLEMKPIKELEMLIVKLEEQKTIEHYNGNPVIVPIKEYRVLLPEMVDNIVYSNDNKKVLITLKDSDLCYLGIYNDIEKDYIYTTLGSENLIEVNNYKTLSKKN